MSVRAAAKAAAEAGMVWSGWARRVRRQHRADALILAYHNVVPRGERVVGDRSLHLPQQAFAEQLDCIGRTHEVVPLADVLDPDAGPAGAPRVAITFDDGYRGALTAGVAELRARGLPATVFVTPGHLGNSGFWWDVLAHPKRGLDPALRSHVLGACAGRHDTALAWAADHSDTGRTTPPPHACAATTDEITTALEYPALTLAAHTWSHPNLTVVGDAALEEELVRPLEWLAPFGQRALRVVSYPYGLSDARVEAAARAAGYAAGLRISGGWITPQSRAAAFAQPRQDIPSGISRRGFVLRTAGVITR